MDYANQRYVKFYPAVTASLGLPWEAQALWMLLTCKADLAGVLQAPGRMTVARAVQLAVGMPADVVAQALQLLDEAGIVAIDDDLGRLELLDFEAQQNARASGAQRVRDHRARAFARCKRDNIAPRICEERTQEITFQAVTERYTDVPAATDSSSELMVFGSGAHERVTPGNQLLKGHPLPRSDRPANQAATAEPCGPSFVPDATKNKPIVVVALPSRQDDRTPQPIAAGMDDARATLLVHQWLADTRNDWAAKVIELERDAQIGRKLRPPMPWAGSGFDRHRKFVGIAAALADHGSDTVKAVMLAELERWARTDPLDKAAHNRASAFLARMFIDGGFSAAHARWARDEARWDIGRRKAGFA